MIARQIPLEFHEEFRPRTLPAKQIVRHKQIERQWRLLMRLLSWRRGVTLHSLCDAIVDLGDVPVSERTVRRDIDALVGAGFSIATGRDEGGVFWRLDEPGRALVSRLALSRRSETEAA